MPKTSVHAVSTAMDDTAFERNRTSLANPEQEMAFEESQKYKEGKFIIEKARVMTVKDDA